MSKVQCPLFNEVSFSQVDKTITLKPTERLLTLEQSNIVIARTLDFGYWTLDSTEILDLFLVFRSALQTTAAAVRFRLRPAVVELRPTIVHF
jgi:hypothetical protein